MADSKWPEIPLSDCVENTQISYGVVQPGMEDAGGVPIVRVKDLRHGLIDATAPARVSEQIAARHGKTTLRGGEVLVSLVGTVGEAAIVPPALAGWNVARAVAVLRPNGMSARWLQLCFQTDSVVNQVAAAVNTTVQTTLNLSDLKKVLVPAPDSHTRDAIADVLGALDDKIAANTRLAVTTEQLARATYLSMIDPSLSAPLSSLAEFVNGRAYTKDASGTGRVVVRIAELNSGLGGSTVFSDADVPDRHVAHPGDILFAWSGSLTLHRWFREDAIVNQHIFKVIPHADQRAWLVWQSIAGLLDHFKAVAADKATTMGHIQRHHLDEPVSLPRPELVKANSAVMESLWERGLRAERENLTLAATRDALLPALMSGKLRVRDAEQLASDLT